MLVNGPCMLVFLRNRVVNDTSYFGLAQRRVSFASLRYSLIHFFHCYFFQFFKKSLVFTQMLCIPIFQWRCLDFSKQERHWELSVSSQLAPDKSTNRQICGCSQTPGMACLNSLCETNDLKNINSMYPTCHQIQLTLYVLFFQKEQKHVFTIYVIYPPWLYTDNQNPSPCQTRT